MRPHRQPQSSYGRVHLVVSDLYPGDAIGNFVLSVYAMLARRKIPARLYAERFDADLKDVRPYATFFDVVKSGDTLFYQLSNYDPVLPELMDAPCRRVIYYHNITPGHFFAPYSPEIAALLDAGRAALPLVAKADVLLANSWYSLSEVAAYAPRSTTCAFFPPFLAGQISPFALPRSNSEPSSSLPFPYLLTLGRVVPHKRVEDAIRIFSLLHAARQELRLVIVGPHYEPYVATLNHVLEDAYPDLPEYILFTGKLSHEDVTRFVCHAAALLHTSAHEGFCMPVFEAMLAGIPVFANNQEAVAEILGGSGVLFEASSPATAARKIMDASSDLHVQNRMVAAQYERAKQLCSLADEELLLGFLLSPTHCPVKLHSTSGGVALPNKPGY